MLRKGMLLNDFAFHCFRDIAGADYIGARMAAAGLDALGALWVCTCLGRRLTPHLDRWTQERLKRK